MYLGWGVWRVKWGLKSGQKWTFFRCDVGRFLHFGVKKIMILGEVEPHIYSPDYPAPQPP